MAPSSVFGWISWMSLNRMSKRDRSHSSIVDRDERVREDGHASDVLGMAIVLTPPSEA